MDDVYEVDNRYPEVFEPYEKIRGVRRHGGLENARRAARFNQVKRGFWTAAAAAVSAVTLLLASFGGGSQAAAPEPFQDPGVEIIATAPSGTTEASAPPETETLYTEVPETEPPVTEATQTEPTPTELFTAPTLTVTEADIRNFQNRSRVDSLAIIICAVSYGSDLRKLEKLMREALPGTKENHSELYLSDIRYMGVDELADSGVNLKFCVSTTEEKFFQARRALNRDVKLLLDDNGFEIPFPQVVVHQGK